MTILQRILFVGLMGLCVLAAGGALHADPCLVVYPNSPCTYHYDPAEYYTVGPGDPLYNPAYDRGGQVLVLRSTNTIDLSIYQAPYLTAFVPISVGEDEGYFFAGTTFTLVIDGFSGSGPTTYPNILVIFDNPVPSSCAPLISVNGAPISGNVYHAGDLVVTTPTGRGNSYSDVLTAYVDWRGCYGLHVWAFSDANYDGKREGKECFTAFSHDLTIPVQGSTWGAIKSLYQ